jgi:hypothetical protein
MNGEITMAIDQRQDLGKRYGQVVARAWGDDAFKARLLAEPAPALAEHGIELPPGLEVRVYEDTARLVHLTLPPAPPDELSDEQLDAVAGGDTAGTSSTLATLSCPVSTAGSIGSAASASA